MFSEINDREKYRLGLGLGERKGERMVVYTLGSRYSIPAHLGQDKTGPPRRLYVHLTTAKQ